MRRALLYAVGAVTAVVVGTLSYQYYQAAQRAAYQASLEPHVIAAARYVDELIEHSSGWFLSLKVDATALDATLQDLATRSAELDSIARDIREKSKGKHADITDPVANYLKACNGLVVRTSGMVSRTNATISSLNTLAADLQKKTVDNPIAARAQIDAMELAAKTAEHTLDLVSHDLAEFDTDISKLKEAETLVRPLYPAVSYTDDANIAVLREGNAKAITELRAMSAQVQQMLAMVGFASLMFDLLQ